MHLSLSSFWRARVREKGGPVIFANEGNFQVCQLFWAAALTTGKESEGKEGKGGGRNLFVLLVMLRTQTFPRKVRSFEEFRFRTSLSFTQIVQRR